MSELLITVPCSYDVHVTNAYVAEKLSAHLFRENLAYCGLLKASSHIVITVEDDCFEFFFPVNLTEKGMKISYNEGVSHLVPENFRDKVRFEITGWAEVFRKDMEEDLCQKG